MLFDFYIETEAYSEPIDQRVGTAELNEYAVVGPNTSDGSNKV